MSILLDRETRVIIQGITGRFGSYHSQMMKEYGTRIVAGVTPGKGGEEVNGVPVYDSIAEARRAQGGDAIGVLVPAPFVKDAVFEAVDAGIGLVVCLVEGVPVKDTVLMKRRLRETGALMIGPNSPGLVSPGKSLLGFMPGAIYRPGPVGIVSRSGTFSYQVADALSRQGIGQSTCVGIGGDPISGISFSHVLDLFEQDSGTELILLVGEIGRTAEEEAAAHVEGAHQQAGPQPHPGRHSPSGQADGARGSHRHRGARYARVQAARHGRGRYTRGPHRHRAGSHGPGETLVTAGAPRSESRSERAETSRPPSLDGWLDELKAGAGAAGVGMYLVHNGVVRGHSRAGEVVGGMVLAVDRARLAGALETVGRREGILAVRAWVNEGRLAVGDDIMRVVVAGDIRENVFPALQDLVREIKTTVVRETELP